MELKRITRIIVLISLGLVMTLNNSLLSQANGPTTRYVSTSGTDIGDCVSPTAPCRTIQYAVNQSASGDRILVAQGTYTYDPGKDPCPFLQTRAVVCFVDKRLTILGGYSGTDWSTANPVANPTIIDGGNIYRGVAVIGYNTTTSYLHMEGFTIQNCRVQGPTYLNPYDPSGVGGGMLVQHASVTLKNVIFRNNRVFGQNTSFGAGGQADGAALRIEESPPSTVSLLQHVVFDGNASYGGSGPDRGGVAFGALFIYKANVVIEDAVFTNNLAQAGNSTGSGSYGNPPHADALGGAIAIEEGTITLRRVAVTGNRVKGGNAYTYGGGAYGGGIFVEDFGNQVTSVTISDSYIANNIAIGGDGARGGSAAGGGIDVDSAAVTIERTSIISNTALGGSGTNPGPGAGGGLYAFAVRSGSFPVTLRNVIVAGNLADQGSGGTHPGNGGGGGIVIHGVQASMSHVTIARNRLGSALVLGQGLLIQPWPSPLDPQFPAVVTLTHSVVSDHGEGNPSAPAILIQQGSTLTFNQGMFAGNSMDTNNSGYPVAAGTINGLETMRSVTSIGFIAPGSLYHNYHLRQNSAAKDQATSSSITDDIDQENRPYGNNSDFGADEYHPFRLTFVPGDMVIRLDWSAGSRVLQGGVGHYMLHLVSCEEGANPPQEVGCGQALNVGNSTSFTLTALTNFKRYTVEIQAYDPTDSLIAVSERVVAFPTTIFVFLPVVLR